MKAWILSDLHCDHGTIPPPVPPEADIAIIAGDVMNDEWLLEVAQHLPVIFVAGNHEFYGSMWSERMETLRGFEHHVWTLENASYRCVDMQTFDHGPLIAGATLWTDYNNDPAAAREARERMNDHKLIKWSKQPYQRFLPSHATKLHRESLTYLKQSNADVIVTHHAPHYGSVHPRYDGQLLNYAYFSHALEQFDNPPKLWVHGHTHNCFDYIVGETRVICNPHGYPGENAAFDPALIMEI